MKNEKNYFTLVTETWQNKNLPLKEVAAPSFATGSKKSRPHAGTGIILNREFVSPSDIQNIASDEINGRYSVFSFREIVFVLLYLSPSLSAENVGETMDAAFKAAFKNYPKSVVVAGDFNIDLLADYNSKFETAQNLLLDQGLVLMNLLEPTHKLIGHRGTLIDHIYSRGIHVVSKAKPMPKVCLGASSHFIVEATIVVPDLPKEAAVTKAMTNFVKLKDMQVRRKFIEEIAPGLVQLEDELEKKIQQCEGESSAHRVENTKFATKMDEEITKILLEGAKTVCGTKRISRSAEREVKLSPEYRADFQKLQALQRLSVKFPQENSIAQAKNELIKKMAAKEERQKQLSFQVFCKKVGSLPANKRWKFLKRFACPFRKSLLKNDKPGMEIIAKHFEGQFNNERGLPKHSGFSWEMHCLDTTKVEKYFDQTEIEDLISWLPEGKAPGCSGLTNEVLKAASSDLLCSLLSKFFKFLYVTGSAPNSWKIAEIRPVPKKGDPSKVENYRPISLLENLRKLYERVLEKIMLSQMKSLCEEQGGFRIGRSTLDQCQILQEVIHTFKVKAKKAPIMAFLDIKAAYDSVDRAILLQRCIEYGISQATVESIRQIFDFNKASVNVQGKKTRTFHLKSGVQQGSIISPLLYSIFIDGLRNHLQPVGFLKIDKDPSSMGDMMKKRQRLNMLMHADDIVIFGQNKNEVQSLLDKASKYARDNLFSFNLKKCVYIAPSGTPLLSIDGNLIDRTQFFNYLGILLTTKGINTRCQIERAREKCVAAASMIERIGCNGSGFDLQVKIGLYKSIVRSRKEYGLAICPETKSNEKFMESTQYKCLCRMLSVFTNSSYKKLLVFTGLESMATRLVILKEKFRVRLKKWKELGMSFLAKYIELEESTLEVVPNYQCESREEAELELSVALDWEQSKANSKRIQSFKRRKSEATLAEVREKDDTPIWRLGMNVLGRFFLKSRVEPLKMRLVLLYLLNKLPGRNAECVRCKVPMNKSHFVECNETIWKEIQKSCSSQKTKMPENDATTMNIPRNGMLISSLLAQAIEGDNWYYCKNLVERIANGIQKSAKICSWPGKEECHVL